MRTTARRGLANRSRFVAATLRGETRETPPTPLFREESYVENNRTSDERRRCGRRHRRRHAVLRGRHRRPRHQDQHQSVLRQDEGGLRGQSQGTRPHPAGLCRQGRRRQRRRSQGDRAADRRRRQGHPAGAERFDGDRADGEEGARRRHHRHHARHAARSGRRRRRAVRHRQLQGRRTDRPVGQGHARRQGGKRQDRHARPDAPISRPSTICATTASSPASASR